MPTDTMAKKRKQELSASKLGQPQKKQQQSLEGVQKKEEEIKILEAAQEDDKEDINNDENEEENEEEDEEEDEGNEEEEDGEEDAEDDDPIDKLLEPFSRDQLLNLLKEAADKHHDVASRIRGIADQDPVHRKIFVYGLGWDATAETLVNAFRIYGEIEDCKAVMDKASGKSKGYGFILFKKRSGARKALEQPQKKIGNRTTTCQLASIGPVPSSGVATPAFPTQHVSEYTQRKIYVSNVGTELDPQKLTALFAKFGEIEEGPLGLDKVSGKPKGFCLFVYKTIESAKKALEEPHKNFEGHILHCQRAIDGPKSAKTQKQLHQPRPNMQNSHYQQHNLGGAAGGSGHLMAPAAGPGAGFSQGASAAPALNSAIGQALTALLANPGAGASLTNLLGTFGSVAAASQGGVPGAAPGMPPAYGDHANVNQGMIGTYGSQGGVYQSQQAGYGGTGRGQPGAGQYGGAAPYMGH